MTHEPQLWQATSPQFRLPGFPSKGNKDRWAAPGLRMIFWPSGRVCWEANAYLISLRRHGCQTSSINTYASELGIFVRFLARSNIRFSEATDDTLIDFADWLQKRRVSSGRHTNRILLRSIDILDWMQTILVGKNLVGEVGSGAQVCVKVRYVKKDGFVRKVVRHPAMVSVESRRVVRPASIDVLTELLSACDESAKSSFCVSRNRAIVVLLADSGVRREEVVWVKCTDISKAIEKGGSLEIRTSKRKGNPKRMVPVPEETLRHISSYLDVHRALQIRRLKRRNKTFKDDDWAFCTRTGGRLAPESVTQLFGDLRCLAGISERATAHMLRHRFITLQVVHRLKQLRGSGAIGVEAMSTILSRVSSISGHAKISSLWTYVDWAYDEMAADRASPQQIKEALGIVNEMVRRLENDGDSEVLDSLRKVKAVLQEANGTMAAVQSITAHSLRRER